MTRDVFISYSRDNYDSVIEIKRQIDSAVGTECWIDLKGIESGSEQFPDDIIDGINNCKVFLFMLTEQSQESKWALRELAFAENKKKHVVIVNVDGIEMNDRFRFKYVFTDTISWNDHRQRDKLICDLCHWINTAPRPQSTILDRLQDLKKRLAKLDKEVGQLVPFSGSNGKYGYLNKEGEIVIPCNWNCAWNFSEGLARVKDSNGKYGYIDKEGEIVIPCNWDWNYAWNFREGLARVKDSNGKWGFIKKTGEIVIPCSWDDAGNFNKSRLAKVKDSKGKWGFIKKTGQIVIPCNWESAGNFREGLARVKDSNGKWGFIFKNGEIDIPCNWDDAYDFKNGAAKVKDSNGKWVWINRFGAVIS